MLPATRSVQECSNSSQSCPVPEQLTLSPLAVWAVSTSAQVEARRFRLPQRRAAGARLKLFRHRPVS